MAKLRSEISPEEGHVNIIGPTTFKTAENQQELRCGVCGDLSFVDEETFRRVTRAIEEGLDNPFMCGDCEDEYDDLAHGG